MKFADIIGNERAIKQIRRMIDSDSLPHALLLHGEYGIPKMALARATVQYLHCTNKTNGDSCGSCPSCLQHQSLNHADTFFSYPIIKKGENPTSEDFNEEWREFLNKNAIVEDYEQWLALLGNANAQPMIYQSESDSIVKKMSYAAYTAQNKVLIMWMPEKMNEACANKLLKLIEEPSDDSVFILVSDNIKGILPTILSRTQRIELTKPGIEQISKYITDTYSVEPDVARAIVAPADGNVNQAISNLRNDSETKDFHKRFVSLMRLAYTRNLKELKQWSEDIADYKREKSRRFLAYASRMVRENFIYNLHMPQLNYQTNDEAQFSTKFAPFINEQNAEPLINLFNVASTDIQGNGNAKIILFDMAIKVTILIKP